MVSYRQQVIPRGFVPFGSLFGCGITFISSQGNLGVDDDAPLIGKPDDNVRTESSPVLRDGMVLDIVMNILLQSRVFEVGFQDKFPPERICQCFP